jgi:endonuclease III related protein
LLAARARLIERKGPLNDEGREAALREAYARMREAFGHRRWWPAKTPVEMCVGAILVQNTTWTAASTAISRLESAGCLELEALRALEDEQLEDLIRPAGCPRVKARRLRAFLAAIPTAGLAELFAGPLTDVRARVLAVHGIGPETADCMLLYAGNRLSYVVDAYTRRVFERHGWTKAGAGYESVRALCTDAFSTGAETERLDLWRDGHAQWVEVGKRHCRAGAPDCTGCPLKGLLPAGGPVISSPRGRRGGSR